MYKFISTLTKDQVNISDQSKLLEKLRKTGLETEEELSSRNVRNLILPYFVDKTDRKVFQNDAVHFQNLRDLAPKNRKVCLVEKSLKGSASLMFIEEIVRFLMPKIARKVIKPELKYREHEVPMISVESFPVEPFRNQKTKNNSNKHAREALKQLIQSIVLSDRPLDQLKVSNKWQLGLG